MIRGARYFLIGLAGVALVGVSGYAKLTHDRLQTARAALDSAENDLEHARQSAQRAQAALQREQITRRNLAEELSAAQATLSEAASQDPQFRAWQHEPLPSAAKEVLR